MEKQHHNSQWDAGRFLKTLTYFEVIPFIGCIERFLTGRAQNKDDHQTKFMLNNSETETKLLFDFTNSNADLQETWGAVDDVVMGGVSNSNIRLLENKAIFSGVVSTDNNGGFASVRTRNFNPPLDLSSYKGIELRVQGDGKRYKFIIRGEERWDGIGYCYSFDTVHNYWTTMRIPFADLIPVFRAKTVNNAGAFDASKVYSMQLMLSKFEYDGELNKKFEAGFFALEIESIKSYN